MRGRGDAVRNGWSGQEQRGERVRKNEEGDKNAGVGGGKREIGVWRKRRDERTREQRESAREEGGGVEG